MARPQVALLKVLDLTPLGAECGAGAFFLLRLASPGWTWRAGQFVMLRPESFGKELPWGRPFGICRLTDEALTCFFQVRGQGTRRMAALRPGDAVRVWGPLGNGFALQPEKPALLLAGGMGVAPFVAYAERHPAPENLAMLFGHRAPLACYPARLLAERVAFESMLEEKPGDLQNFLETVRRRMAQCAGEGGLILACGPTPFLRVVQEEAARLGARAQLSLENRMACGVGACLGCVVKSSAAWPVAQTRESPVQACTHGPVFWADQVELG